MVRIVAIAIVCAVIIIYLRSVNTELAMLAAVGSGIIILGVAFQYIYDTFEFVGRLVEMTGIDKNLYGIIFKITAIGYLVEFGAGTLKDFGLNGLSDKLVFVGKLVILGVSLPIIYSIINLLSGLVQ